MKDLHELPKMRDSLSYLFAEHAMIDRKDSSIEILQKEGSIQVPVASLCVLLLGPGTSITHAAITALAENGCLVEWVGEDSLKFYASGYGETRKATHLIRQAELVSDPGKRGRVVRKMYQKRFNQVLGPELSLVQIRGMEGARVRDCYAEASKLFGVEWTGRNYDMQHWGASDTINRVLSRANSLLYGICQAAIISGGYSPGLGFVHNGRHLSFVYDIADLYKADTIIPLSFQVTAEHGNKAESMIRPACRDAFHEYRLLEKILPDIDDLMDMAEILPDEPTIPHPEEMLQLWEALYEKVAE
jgi:CRISP-associated protein Cas1